MGACNRDSKAPDVDYGAQFLVARTGTPFGSVLKLLEQQGALSRWTGRFGILGSRGGGFLPKEIVDSTQLAPDPEMQKRAFVGEGDFCGFLSAGKASETEMYVGTPSMAHVCEAICELGDVEVVRNQSIKVEDSLRYEGGAEEGAPRWRLGDEVFDGVVLATHDASMAAKVIEGILASPTANAAVTQTEKDFLLGDLCGKLNAVREEKEPVYTLTATFPTTDAPSEHLNFEAAVLPTSSHLQFLCHDTAKPGKASSDGSETWTAISSVPLARELLAAKASNEIITETLKAHVLDVMAHFTPGRRLTTEKAWAKRWGAGFTGGPLPASSFTDQKPLVSHGHSLSLERFGLAVCGDFVHHEGATSPLEAAALSGIEAAERLAEAEFHTIPAATDGRRLY
jgi:predicted NAD/FAD-dependent oxidoreductase